MSELPEQPKRLPYELTQTQLQVRQMFGVEPEMLCTGIAFGRHQDLAKDPIILDFNDPLSRKEYGITGMCQSCQDRLFDQDEEDDGPDDYCTTCHSMIAYVTAVSYNDINVTEFSCGHSQWLWMPDREQMVREEALTDGIIL